MSQAAFMASLSDLVRKDARRRSRRKTLGKLAVAIVQSALLSLAYGWYLMLAVGVVHHEWIRSCPTIGFWWAVLLCLLLRSALVPFSKSGEDR